MFIWDEKKRQANLVKHRLDFADAALVYDNPAKLTRRSERQGEQRYADIAIVEVHGICLTLIYLPRGGDVRVIFFRSSSRAERTLFRESNRLGSSPSHANGGHTDPHDPNDPDDGPYDPNDADAVTAFWNEGAAPRSRRLLRSPGV